MRSGVNWSCGATEFDKSIDPRPVDYEARRTSHETTKPTQYDRVDLGCDLFRGRHSPRRFLVAKTQSAAGLSVPRFPREMSEIW